MPRIAFSAFTLQHWFGLVTVKAFSKLDTPHVTQHQTKPKPLVFEKDNPARPELNP